MFHIAGLLHPTLILSVSTVFSDYSQRYKIIYISSCFCRKK